MVKIDNASALKLLQNFVNKTTDKKDTETTRGEIRRLLDKNKDGFVSADELKDNRDLLRFAANELDLSSVKNPEERAKLERVQKYLRDLLQDAGVTRNAPPKNKDAQKIKDDPLVKDPHDLKDKKAMKRWTNERNKYMDKTIKINLADEKRNIEGKLGKDKKDVAGLIEKLWTNKDAVDGKETNVLRMNELIGLWAYAKDNPEMRDKFIKEMAKFVNNPKNGMDQQFVLDSLLQVIQSTDFEGQGDFKSFLEDMAIQIAKGGEFAKRGDGVIANYDGSNSKDGAFGSLALIKEGDNFKFIEHDPSVDARKTRYILNEGSDSSSSPSARGGFGAGRTAPPAPSDISTVKPGSKLTNPSELQKVLDEIKKSLDELEKKIDDNNKKDFKKTKDGLDVEIPTLIKNSNIKGLEDLINNLKNLQSLAKKHGLDSLADKIEALIKSLEAHLKDIQSKRNSGFAAGRRTTTTDKVTPKTGDRPPTGEVPREHATRSTPKREATAPPPKTKTPQSSTISRTPKITQPRTTRTIRSTPAPKPKEADVGKLEVRWARDGNTLIHESTDRYGAPVHMMFKAHSTFQADGSVKTKWYEIMDRDLQYPYTHVTGKGKISYLVPYDDDAKKDFAAKKLPYMVQKTLKDPRLMSHVYGSKGIVTTNGYSFVSRGRNVYFSSNQLDWYSTNPNDNAVYSVERRGATITNVIKTDRTL